MKEVNFKKVILLFLVSMMLGACSNTKSQESNDSENSKISEPQSSSKSETTSTNNESSFSSSVSQNSSSQTNRPYTTFGSELSYSLSKPSYTAQEESYTLQHQDHDSSCSQNDFTKESIVKEATIISKGVKRYSCPECQGFKEEFYYDLEECAFESATFAYDGQERQLYIRGLLPLGVKVIYENNKLTEIGSIEATAKLYDEDDHLLATKTATLAIVENNGFADFHIETETGQDPSYKEKTNYTQMTLTVDNCPAQYRKNAFAGGIRVRGNSTNQDAVTKRAWRLKFNNKTNLMGLNGGQKFKSWVLMADYFDQSMFRNYSAWYMGRSLFKYSGNYASDATHVNLYMNGDYRGVYLLGEQQQCNTGRLSLAEPEDGETSTNVGYLLEIDGLIAQGKSDEEYNFTINVGSSQQGGWGGWGGFGGTNKSYAVKSDIFDEAQFEYIKKYVTNVFTILENAVKTGSNKKLQTLDENHDLITSPYDNEFETLNAVIDIESLFKMYVLQELMRNYDVGWGSFYLFVDFSENSAHKRLTFGAPWDFDWSSGNANNSFTYNTDGTFINNSQAANSMTFYNPWLADLGKTDFFNEMIKKYYTVFAQSDIYQGLYEVIKYETCAFSEEFKRNYDKWGTLNGTEVTMYTRSDVVKKYKVHQDAVKFYLDWLQERKTYMDKTYLLS